MTDDAYEVEFSKDLLIYFVETDQQNQNHHGLHTNHAPHVITTSPRRGDTVAHVLFGRLTYVLDEGDRCLRPAQFDLHLRECSGGGGEILVVERHGGRSAMLGEDDWDEAFGGDALSVLIPEILGDRSWAYAPVTVTPLHPLAGSEMTREELARRSRRRRVLNADARWVEVER